MAGATCVPDARNHYPQIKHHTPPPKPGATTSPIPGFPHSGRRDSGPVVSKPNSVSDDFLAAPRLLNEDVPGAAMFVVHQNHTHYTRGPSSRFAHGHSDPRYAGPPGARAAP